MVAAAVMIVTACIPAVLYYLDRIVAYYGLFFMPLGAFIFIDFWLFPRLGLTHYYAERRGLKASWPSAVGWFGSFAICFLLYDQQVNSILFGRLQGGPVFAGTARLDHCRDTLYRVQFHSAICFSR